MRGIKWPGRANLVVSLIALHRGAQESVPRVLDKRSVRYISAFLEDYADLGPPRRLAENIAKVFMGPIISGNGFFLSREEATSLTSTDPSYTEVIFPVINGEELNSHPAQEPERFAINFFDWSIEKAEKYDAAYRRIAELVRPEREKNSRIAGLPWWRYERPRPDLFNLLRGTSRCFLVAATTKHLNFSVSPSARVFTHALFVFTTDRWDLYAVVQSTLHEVWARKYSGALETRLRYSPSDCFENFPFPEGLWQIASPTLAESGERYHENRRALMRQLWLGLTDIYNLFHTRDLSPGVVAKVSKKSPAEAEVGYRGILELRRLHRQLDESIRAAYGWHDLDLGHDFHEVDTLPENDRVRYTVSPSARKEVVRRLLALNHQRAALEIATAPVKKKRSKKRTGDEAHEDFFDPSHRRPLPEITRKPAPLVVPAQLPDGAWARSGTDRVADAGAILAAILKTAGGPESIRTVRLAAILAEEPRLLTPTVAEDEALLWRRLVGAEAALIASDVRQFIPAADRAWGSAVQQLRGSGMLIEDLAANTWAPGPGLDGIQTDGWPDGRASVVLSVLRRHSTDEVIRQLPEEVQRWVDAQAA
jgi:hypothetical protein